MAGPMDPLPARCSKAGRPVRVYTPTPMGFATKGSFRKASDPARVHTSTPMGRVTKGSFQTACSMERAFLILRMGGVTKENFLRFGALVKAQFSTRAARPWTENSGKISFMVMG